MSIVIGNNNPLRTLKEAAQMLGISEFVLWQIRKDREIGQLKIAGKTYIPQADIDAYLQQNYMPAKNKLAA